MFFANSLKKKNYSHLPEIKIFRYLGDMRNPHALFITD